MKPEFQHPKKPDLYRRRECDRYYPKDRFAPSTLQRNLQQCRRCFSAKTQDCHEKAWGRPGGILLRRLKVRERRLSSGDASHLQGLEDKDMVYLYETLWERRSALVVSEEEKE